MCASGHQCKVQMRGSEKKANENTYDITKLWCWFENVLTSIATKYIADFVNLRDVCYKGE